MVLHKRPAPGLADPEEGGVQPVHQGSVLGDGHHVVGDLDEVAQPPREGLRALAPPHELLERPAAYAPAAPDLHARQAALPAPAVDRHLAHAEVPGDLLRTEQFLQPLRHVPRFLRPGALRPRPRRSRSSFNILRYLTVLEFT